MMVEMQKRSQQQEAQAAAAAQSAGISPASSQQGIQGQSQGPRVNQASNVQSIPSTNAPVSQSGNKYALLISRARVCCNGNSVSQMVVG